MGTDMHILQEVKIKGEWHHYGYMQPGRNYPLFRFVAGVTGGARRTAPGALLLIKGTPADITPMSTIHLKKWNGDAHHVTYADSVEIRAIEDWFMERSKALRDPYEERAKNFGYCFGNSWSGFEEYPEDREDDLEDIRWIIFFDN